MTNPGVPRPGQTEPAQRLAEALHAQVSTRSTAPPHTGAPVRPRPPEPGRDPGLRRQIGWALAVALLAGLVLGCVIALVSLLFPGVLPTVG